MPTSPKESSPSFLRALGHQGLRLLQRAGRLEKTVLVFIVFIAAALFGFAELADDVMEGDTHAFDEMVLLALRDANDVADPWGPRWLEEMMRDFTALGGIGVLTLITLGVSGLFLFTRRYPMALLVAGSVSSGVLLSTLFKMGFERARPDLVPHLSIVHTMSFPSGHAMMSAVVYLTLGVLLARLYTDVRIKVYLLTLAVLITILVGFSRVYLGVHWPTDVLAGWTMGAAWSACCWLLMLWLQSRGRVEREGGLN